ncbi:MAG: hypothetical protein AB7N71_14155 [Phycisphaerae bacterium]
MRNGCILISSRIDAATTAALVEQCNGAIVGREHDADEAPVADELADKPVAWRFTSVIAKAPPEPAVWHPPRVSDAFERLLTAAGQQSALLITLTEAALREPGTEAKANGDFDLQEAYAVLTRHRFLIESFAVPVALHLPALQAGGRLELIADFLDEINSPYIGWGHELTICDANAGTIARLRDELAHRLFGFYLRTAMDRLHDAREVFAVRELLSPEVPLIVLPE